MSSISVADNSRSLRLVLFATILVGVCSAHAEPSPSVRPAADQTEPWSKVDVPVVLCIDDKPSVGGQPSGGAYAKAAANGYRSVLTLRSKQDGVDQTREQLMVEHQRMRYFNIPPTGNLPRPAQVDEFLRLVRDKTNHPMLVNCAFAERVTPFMMILRISEQGWSEEKAVEEAGQSGLKADQLRKFAKDYLAHRKRKQSPAVKPMSNAP